MKKKYIFMGVGLLLILIFIYLRNIIFALALHSENIDRQTIGVMLHGRFAPTKEINLIINNSSYNIPLPNGSGKLKDREYLVPTSSWKGYRDELNKTEWNYFDQLGTLIRVKNKFGDEFDISIKPFTGAYQLLKYSSVKANTKLQNNDRQSILDKSITLRMEIDEIKNEKIKDIVEDKKETLKNGIYGCISNVEKRYYILINGVDYWYSNISFTIKDKVLTISYCTEYEKGLRVKQLFVINPNNEESFDKVELINNGNKEIFKILYEQ